MIILKKIKAFTVIELIVAMLIGSIVISIVYYTLALMQKHLIQTQETRSLTSDYLLLNKTLQRDIDEAKFITKVSERELLFSFENKYSVAYSFLDNDILRNHSSNIDSFHIATERLSLNWLEEKNIQLITQLNIETKCKGHKFKEFYNKYYSARDLLSVQNYFDE
jgi:prepilin-type N-terminal cleavage/methylation domain-containing protein